VNALGLAGVQTGVDRRRLTCGKGVWTPHPSPRRPRLASQGSRRARLRRRRKRRRRSPSPRGHQDGPGRLAWDAPGRVERPSSTRTPLAVTTLAVVSFSPESPRGASFKNAGSSSCGPGCLLTFEQAQYLAPLAVGAVGSVLSTLYRKIEFHRAWPQALDRSKCPRQQARGRSILEGR